MSATANKCEACGHDADRHSRHCGSSCNHAECNVLGCQCRTYVPVSLAPSPAGAKCACEWYETGGVHAADCPKRDPSPPPAEKVRRYVAEPRIKGAYEEVVLASDHDREVAQLREEVARLREKLADRPPYTAIHEAWARIGADRLGLHWNKFTRLIDDARHVFGDDTFTSPSPSEREEA